MEMTLENLLKDRSENFQSLLYNGDIVFFSKIIPGLIGEFEKIVRYVDENTTDKTNVNTLYTHIQGLYQFVNHDADRYGYWQKNRELTFFKRNLSELCLLIYEVCRHHRNDIFNKVIEVEQILN